MNQGDRLGRTIQENMSATTSKRSLSEHTSNWRSIDGSSGHTSESEDSSESTEMSGGDVEFFGVVAPDVAALTDSEDDPGSEPSVPE